MKYKCIIIDDETHAIEVLNDLISEFPDLSLIGRHTDPIKGLKAVNDTLPDILFLDIEMPKLSGIELSALLNPGIKVVYTTASPDFAITAFETAALDYLLKPISYKRFRKFYDKLTLTTIVKKKSPSDIDPFIFVKCENKGKMVRLNLDDINYVESDNNYVIINTVMGQHKTYLTLKEIENALSASSFARIHKRFIVNYSRIKYIDGNRVFLNDKSVLQIGITYRLPFLELINKHVISTER